MTRGCRAGLLRSSRQHPATTTLPSEGHQNILVNAAFVLRQGGATRGAGLFVQPQQAAAWRRRRRPRKAVEGFKEAVVHLQVSPLGLIRCESSASAEESYYKYVKICQVND